MEVGAPLAFVSRGRGSDGISPKSTLIIGDAGRVTAGSVGRVKLGVPLHEHVDAVTGRGSITILLAKNRIEGLHSVKPHVPVSFNGALDVTERLRVALRNRGSIGNSLSCISH